MTCKCMSKEQITSNQSQKLQNHLILSSIVVESSQSACPEKLSTSVSLNSIPPINYLHPDVIMMHILHKRVYEKLPVLLYTRRTICL